MAMVRFFLNLLNSENEEESGKIVRIARRSYINLAPDCYTQAAPRFPRSFRYALRSFMVLKCAWFVSLLRFLICLVGYSIFQIIH